MYKLYDLIKFHSELSDYLKSCQPDNILQQKYDLLNRLKFDNINVEIPDLEKYLKEYHDLVSREKDISELLKNSINDIETKINKFINTLDDSYKEKFSEDKLPKSPLFDLEIESKIESTIAKFNSHLYPSLQINPREKKWIDCMTSADPLYLTSHNYEELINLIQDYPKLYQNRLRLYKILNRDFSILPQNQFGYVLCWNNFYHLSHEKIEQYLQEIFKLLRPGGNFMFNYNNSDLKECAEYVDHERYAYMSFKLLKKIINKFGFELVNYHDLETKNNNNPYLSWVELKKPGKLQTVKKSQVLGEIVSK